MTRERQSFGFMLKYFFIIVLDNIIYEAVYEHIFKIYNQETLQQKGKFCNNCKT
jgi:hypothetical protein